MKVLGIAIKKNEVWFSVVSGSEMKNAEIIETGKQIFRADTLAQSLMMEFSNLFDELIAKYRPDRISYKLYLNAKMNQIPYMHYSLGILNLISHQKGIKATERTGNWITAAKGTKIDKFNKYFNGHNYKNEQLAASLIAWFELGE